MDLVTLLDNNQRAVLEAWFEEIIADYPEETAKFLRSKKDRFHNPVGSTIKSETGAILAALIKGGQESPEILNFVDRIVRVRAVQEFKPSQAVGFIFTLKGVIRRLLGDKIKEAGLGDQWSGFQERIDRLGLLAFDVYCSCREKIYEIRHQEIQKHFAMVIRRSGAFEIDEGPEITQDEPDLQKV